MRGQIIWGTGRQRQADRPRRRRCDPRRRRETVHALARNPVFVGGNQMPASGYLPEGSDRKCSAARSARKQTTSAASAITPSSRRRSRARSPAARPRAGCATVPRVLEVAGREHVVGGDDAQLLGDEADRDRQQRVELVEAARGPSSAEEDDAGERRVGERERLRDAQRRTRTPGSARTVPARRAPKSADSPLTAAARARPDTASVAPAHVARRREYRAVCH